MRTEPAHLVRIVAQDGRAVVDIDRRLPGRGAWVHATERCAEQAKARIPRALRQRHLDLTPLDEWVQDGLDEPRPKE